MREENPLRLEKKRKLLALKEAGINPFPYRFDKTHAVSQLRTQYESKIAVGVVTQVRVSVAGRVMTLRSMGKASFFNIQDEGAQIQIYLRNEELPCDQLKALGLLDLGDIVGIQGCLFKTK